MKQQSIQNLARILNIRTRRQNGSIAAVSTDSRSVSRGDCFFAILGPNFDGHNFVGQAIRKGAVCAVVQKNRVSSIEHRASDNILMVDDTVKALGQFAAYYRRNSDFRVIAVTGSVGKTTTRHIIAHVLNSKYRVSQAPKNFNNKIGLPLTLLAAGPDNQFVVAELGTNKPGEIAYLSKIACPDVAVVTNVCPAHLEGFGTLEAIIEEKLSITDGLSPGGKLLINGDNENLIETARRRGLYFKTFGLSQRCDIHPEQSDWNYDSSRFTVGQTMITLPLVGRGNLENALAAWAVCNELGFTAGQFTDAVRNLPAVPMRTDIKHLGTITVIDDCYNANPGSMKNALELLSTLSKYQNRRGACRGEAQRRRVFICGDMAELGAQSQQLHRELASHIVSSGVQLIIGVGSLAAVAASAAKELADYELEVENFTDADCAADNLHKFIKDYDIVLVKGSRTLALEKCVAKLRVLFENGVTSIEHRV
jgi:UDP-N-acetylmuramoyl-tripeptide--D-alanyl-D-alanine ligase